MKEQDFVKALVGAGYSISNYKEFRGHDGFGYNATVKQGKYKVADVTDDGYGGGLCEDYIYDREKFKAFQTFCAGLGVWEDDKELDGHGISVDFDWELAVECLVNEAIRVKEAKKQAKWLAENVVVDIGNHKLQLYRITPSWPVERIIGHLKDKGLHKGCTVRNTGEVL